VEHGADGAAPSSLNLFLSEGGAPSPPFGCLRGLTLDRETETPPFLPATAICPRLRSGRVAPDCSAHTPIACYNVLRSAAADPRSSVAKSVVRRAKANRARRASSNTSPTCSARPIRGRPAHKIRAGDPAGPHIVQRPTHPLASKPRAIALPLRAELTMAAAGRCKRSAARSPIGSAVRPMANGPAVYVEAAARNPIKRFRLDRAIPQSPIEGGSNDAIGLFSFYRLSAKPGADGAAPSSLTVFFRRAALCRRLVTDRRSAASAAA